MPTALQVSGYSMPQWTHLPEAAGKYHLAIHLTWPEESTPYRLAMGTIPTETKLKALT